MNNETGAGRFLEEFVPVPLARTEWSKIRVTGLGVDSRRIKAGDCFIAYPGHVADGRQFIAAAVARGASVVLAEAAGFDGCENAGVPVISIAGLQGRLGQIASAFYADPSRQVQLVAVTGTNGKTTVTQLIAQGLQNLGYASGVMGTLGNGLMGQLEPTSNTTPDIIEVNRLLNAMQAQQVKVVAMEASSHGLVQGRLDGLAVHTGIITNVSRDHLDYHGSMESYRDAKALLAQNPSLQFLVLNADDAVVMGMANAVAPTVNVTKFSLRPDSSADVTASALRFAASGLEIEVRANGKTATLNSALVGEFNAANLLAAIAGMLTLGVDLENACRGLGTVPPVQGRMQTLNFAGNGEKTEGPVVVVDFAHTPDALEQVLSALRRHCHGRLWCVFGCGGDRDEGKRPLMGEIVSRLADEMVVTTDNPRSEKPARILADIVKGIPPEKAFQLIEDRAQAVEFAIFNAGHDDLILLAGKGHEDYQEVLGVKHPYSDVASARKAWKAKQQINNRSNG